jgi:hypothetical protein
MQLGYWLGHRAGEWREELPITDLQTYEVGSKYAMPGGDHSSPSESEPFKVHHASAQVRMGSPLATISLERITSRWYRVAFSFVLRF